MNALTRAPEDQQGSFYNSAAADDGAVRQELAAVPAHRGHASAPVGFADRFEIVQRVSDALASR